jgi:hypothetical protein
MTDFIDVLEQQLVNAHRGRGRRFAIPWRASVVLAGAVLAAAVVVALVVALSSPEPHRAASPPAHRATPAPAAKSPAASLGGVALAVLNGTTVTGLARGAADRLTSSGYNEPNVVTNDTTNQTRQRTTVYYEPDHKGDAQGVAACLQIGLDRVVPMDANARALSDRAEVAVFVGFDRAK